MKNKKNLSKKILFVLIPVITLLLIFVTGEAFGRAGGGHNYSSGGSSGSGGGSGGGELIFNLIFIIVRLVIGLVFNYPIFGIPLLLILMFLAYKGFFIAGNKYKSKIISSAKEMIKISKNSRTTLREIQDKDPDFSEAAFVERTKKAFELIQSAWTNRNLDEVQAFLSDGIYEQFSIQLAEMRENGIIDHLESLYILDAYPVSLQSDKNFDVIHLEVAARAINYRKDEKTGKILGGSKFSEKFSEVWTFMRKPGVKTNKNKNGLMEGQCPSCGNHIKMGRLQKCDICNATLRSGEYDWVLTAITQTCEWSIKSDCSAPGLGAFIESDPDFNLQHLKERAAVIFWRKAEAERIGKIAPLRKVATDELCEAQKEWLQPEKSGLRRFYTSYAVGAINLLGVELLEPMDTAFVEVIWSGKATLQTPGDPLKIADSSTNFKTVFVLVRKHGALTKLESALSSSHCPSCGAPEEIGAGNACQYCGSVMNDGVKEWVLDAILDRNDRQLTNIIQKIAEKDKPVDSKVEQKIEPNCLSGVEVMRWTVAMMLSDGHIDEREMGIIRSQALVESIPDSKLDDILAEFKAVADPSNHAFETNTTKVDLNLLKQMAHVALADGKVTQEEKDMMYTVGSHLSMNQNDIDIFLNQEFEKVYKNAKEIISQQRKQS